MVEVPEMLPGSLPSMSVPDPAFLLTRLQVGKDAGLLTRRPHTGRAGVPHALVSAQPDGAMFVWAIAAPSEPRSAEHLSALPDDLLKGLSAADLRDFAAERNFYYLPLDLLAVLDPALELRQRPTQHLFGTEVDLERDLVRRPVGKALTVLLRSLRREPVGVPPTTPPVVETTPEPEPTEPQPEYAVTVLKATADTPVSEEERITFGVVLVPNERDAQDHIYSEFAVRMAAYSWMEGSKGEMRVMHKGVPVGEKIAILESYVSKQAEAHGDRILPRGTWFVTTRYNDDDLWADVKAGRFTGYSIGGSAIVEPLR